MNNLINCSMNELCVTIPVCGIPVLSLKQVRILSFHDSQSVCVVRVTLQYPQLSVFRLSKSTTALSSSRLRSGSASNWTKLPNQARQTLIPFKDDGIKTDMPFQRIEAGGRESNHKRNLHYEVMARNVGARMRSRTWRGANRPSREIQSVLLPWKRCTQ